MVLIQCLSGHRASRWSAEPKPPTCQGSPGCAASGRRSRTGRLTTLALTRGSRPGLPRQRIRPGGVPQSGHRHEATQRRARLREWESFRPRGAQPEWDVHSVVPARRVRPCRQAAALGTWGDDGAADL